MAFKPGRNEGEDLKRLLTILNQTTTATKNNPLYQFCKSLLNSLENIQSSLLDKLKELKDSIPGSTPSSATALDYVVLSDGVTPIPSPVDDGFGNFVYVPYTS